MTRLCLPDTQTYLPGLLEHMVWLAGQTPSPHPPYMAPPLVRCAPYNVGFVNYFGYNSIGLCSNNKESTSGP